ncbi:MAG: hypothetical protein ACPGSD_00345 [Flavobacteriales bacterium]
MFSKYLYFFTIISILSLFSCGKDDTYPTSFNFKNGKGKTIKVTDYDMVFKDTTMNLFGITSESSLRFISQEGPNAFLVGTKHFSVNGAHQLIYKKDGKAHKATHGFMHVDYLNRFMNFTFKAYFANGDSITNGVGHQVWFNNNNPLPDPDFPIERDSIEVDTNLWNGIAEGFIYQMHVHAAPVYLPTSDLIINDNLQFLNITFYDSTIGYTVEVELKKPLENILGKNFDLTQSMQDQVKVSFIYHLGYTDGSEAEFVFGEGVFQVIHYKSNRISYGFKGRLDDPYDPWNSKDIYFGLGKNIVW